MRVPRPKMPGLKAGCRVALRAHLEDRARLARARHGPFVSLQSLLALTADRECVRFALRLDWGGSVGEPVVGPDEHGGGYRLSLAPALRERPADAALWVAAALPKLNYGTLPTPDDVDFFVAALCDLEPNTARARLSELAREFLTPTP